AWRAERATMATATDGAGVTTGPSVAPIVPPDPDDVAGTLPEATRLTPAWLLAGVVAVAVAAVVGIAIGPVALPLHRVALEPAVARRPSHGRGGRRRGVRHAAGDRVGHPSAPGGAGPARRRAAGRLRRRLPGRVPEPARRPVPARHRRRRRPRGHHRDRDRCG